MVGVIVAYNPIVNELVPEPLYVPANLALGAALLWLVMRSGATLDLLGLHPHRLGRGLRIGAQAAGIAIGGVLLLALLPWTRTYLADERFVGVGLAEALYETAGRIPLGTALGEEVVFRGVLLGLLLRRFTIGGAVAVSSVLFGLWHILPTLDSLQTNPAGDALATTVATAAAVAGTVVTTTLAGVLFTWMRFRAASLAAPIVLHLSINASAYLAGWLVVTNGWAS